MPGRDSGGEQGTKTKQTRAITYNMRRARKATIYIYKWCKTAQIGGQSKDKDLSQNPVLNSNSKHIDVRHHFLRELVRQGDISVRRVPSEYQHADILTKALAFDVFAIHRRFLMNLSGLTSLF